MSLWKSMTEEGPTGNGGRSLQDLVYKRTESVAMFRRDDESMPHL
jgi:hypothetical protein